MHGPGVKGRLADGRLVLSRNEGWDFEGSFAPAGKKEAAATGHPGSPRTRRNMGKKLSQPANIIKHMDFMSLVGLLSHLLLSFLLMAMRNEESRWRTHWKWPMT
jgi:hypothetical protein